METPITPSLRDDFRAKLAELLPPVPAMPDDADDFADAEAFGDYDHAADARRDLQYAACLGALIACPSAFETPYVALCMASGRYDEALDAIATHAGGVAAPAHRYPGTLGPCRLTLVPHALRPEWAWEITAGETHRPVAICPRPFSTLLEAQNDGLTYAEEHGLSVSAIHVQSPSHRASAARAA